MFPDRYKEYLILKTNQDSVNKLVQDKIKECHDWHMIHKHAMVRIQGSTFQKMVADIASSLNQGTPSFAAVKEFLQGAGQGSIVQQVSHGLLRYMFLHLYILNVL